MTTAWHCGRSALPAVFAALALGALAPRAADAALLPAGYLSTRGSQIVGPGGAPVRIACVGGFGTVIAGGRLDYGGPYKGLDANMAAVRASGFNCIRADFNDKSLDDPALMAQFDALVGACGKYGLKVVFDHHNNEATPADWGNAAQQTNGLWFDVGPGTGGTDGAGDKGTISAGRFRQDWVRMAGRWAGNPTVIGFDLDNEPHLNYGGAPNGENWGEGGPGDIRAMFTDVGDAVQAADPGALIICEGPMDVTDKSSILWWMMDLSHVAARPVVLKAPGKVVYSVHEYPNLPNDSGPAYVARMEKDWGYLVHRNIAPVWVGEMGDSMDVADGGKVSVAEQKAWGETLLDYMNGLAPGGLRFSGDEQPVGGDWWLWGCRTGETPDGCLDAAGRVRPAQAPFIARLLFQPGPVVRSPVRARHRN